MRTRVQAVEEWILPHISDGRAARVAEIGCGGGRVAALVAPHVRSLDCLDISPAMLTRARKVAGGGASDTTSKTTIDDSAR